MDEPRIATDVDYGKDGKQISFLGVPNSTSESAYGMVPIPIAVLKNGSGLTIMFTGGVRGAETMRRINRQDHDPASAPLLTPAMSNAATGRGGRSAPCPVRTREEPP